MNYTQLKNLENSINLVQARLGVLRVELKMHQSLSEERANEVQKELDSYLAQIDDLQKKYINAKEVSNG